MWQGFTIALREGIESFLIVALTLSYLRRTGRAGLARAVYLGIAVSVVVCVAAGLLFSQADKKPLWEGILALAAAALVGSLLVYMKRISARMKSDIEHRLEHSARAVTLRRAFWGVFGFTLLMITARGTGDRPSRFDRALPDAFGRGRRAVSPSGWRRRSSLPSRGPASAAEWTFAAC